MVDPPAPSTPAPSYSHPPSSDSVSDLRSTLESFRALLAPAREQPAETNQHVAVASVSTAVFRSTHHRNVSAVDAPPQQPRSTLHDVLQHVPLHSAATSHSVKNKGHIDAAAVSESTVSRSKHRRTINTGPAAKHRLDPIALDAKVRNTSAQLRETCAQLRKTIAMCAQVRETTALVAPLNGSIKPPPTSSSKARLAPNNNYLLDTRSLANRKAEATSIIQRWLTCIIFNRNLKSRLHSRTRIKQRCQVASAYLRHLLSDANNNMGSSAPAPQPLLITTTQRKQRYPTLAETHPFRQRGLSLPPLPPKRKKRRPCRCFRRSQNQTKTRGTPRSKPSIAQNHPPPTPSIHPTRACHLCPAFFHHQSDLDAHLILCQQVLVASPATSPSPATAVLSPAEATSTPSSRPTPSKTTEGGAANTDRDSTTKEAPPASLHPSPCPSSHESDQLMSQLLSALQQLPPSDFLYIDIEKSTYVSSRSDDFLRLT